MSSSTIGSNGSGVHVWAADFDPTEELAQRLITSQFQLLQIDTIELLGVGWDNSAYLVNGHLVFRLPRRNIAAKLLTNETRFLPGIAQHVPLQIPAPIFRGQPEGEYPYPFAGYEFIAGITSDRANLTERERASMAEPLGLFLSMLHGIPITASTAGEAPGDEIGRTDLKGKLDVLKARVTRAYEMLQAEGFDPALLLRNAEELAVVPPATTQPCWVHGDLYARHLLVDESRGLCGVIDWGDLHLGDYALDLSIAYSFLPAAAREAFFVAYGAVDEAAHRRARFKAIFYGEILLEYGLDVDDEALAEVGRYALNNAREATD